MFDPKSTAAEGLSFYGWIVSGILVGIGTKAGNGCTSGHGVCGIPRLSIRSIAAVITFMATCALTATYRYYNPFWTEEYVFTADFETAYRKTTLYIINGLLILFFVIYLWTVVSISESHIPLIEMPLSIVVGGIFALGLCTSGMTRRSKVFGFFTLNQDWDPSLGFVMGGAILVNLATFNYMLKVKKRPFMISTFKLPTNNKIDAKLIFGAATFSIGWGICGMCPGPAMVNTIHLVHSIIWFPSLAAGQLIWEALEKIATPSKPKIKGD